MSSEGVAHGVATYSLESVPDQSHVLVRDGWDAALKGCWLYRPESPGFGTVIVSCKV